MQNKFQQSKSQCSRLQTKLKSFSYTFIAIKKNIEQIMLDFNILISNLEDFTD